MYFYLVLLSHSALSLHRIIFILNGAYFYGKLLYACQFVIFQFLYVSEIPCSRPPTALRHIAEVYGHSLTEP